MACDVEMTKYIMELTLCKRNTLAVANETAVSFWNDRSKVSPVLSAIALDLVTAPASEAFVERIFSLCGQLTTGKRNRMSKTLERKEFL